MSYRDDLEALQQRVRSLEVDADTTARRLDEARRLLDDAKKRLPVLGTVRVATPCEARWNDMVGDERVRFCVQCSKHVYNLSALTRTEAATLLVEREGKVCVRFYQRADGTILTADCADGLRRRTNRRAVATAFGAMSALAAAGAFVHSGAPMREAPVHESEPRAQHAAPKRIDRDAVLESCGGAPAYTLEESAASDDDPMLTSFTSSRRAGD